MKIKTSELTGAALDWAVRESLDRNQLFNYGLLGDVVPSWSPSTSWAQGGPIIERERVAFTVNHAPASPLELKFTAFTPALPVGVQGPTHLIAAMRCLVAAYLGDEVEVPDEIAS